ncbi:carbon-nitrogen hydrolase family protein [Arthrobacter sp. KNU40]|uniref:carbon-nitrogen hydrolase family protein n=1 Tax=Arthrobacter sp. KNU40 TaxID=3447965 RepID=UPI003F60A657
MTEYIGVAKVAAVQAEPSWLDAQAGIDRAIYFISEAARGGANLVAFPELFITGYPWYAWLDSQYRTASFNRRYHENSLVIDGPEIRRLQKAAADNGIIVVMGYSERRGGSLYMSQVLIGADGQLIKNRRKLKPTHTERTMFGDGDGSDIAVFETPIGRLGALQCWEHLQPLTKYAMYSQYEQIHVASWPGGQLFQPDVYAFGSEIGITASKMYALEGQSFVVLASSTVGKAAHDLFADTEEKGKLLGWGGGFARIFGPDGAPLADPLAEDEEGLLFADIDLGKIAEAKFAADPVGHYSRPDVLSLNFRQQATPWVHSAPSASSTPDLGQPKVPAQEVLLNADGDGDFDDFDHQPGGTTGLTRVRG